jgi:hypothetical protein
LAKKPENIRILGEKRKISGFYIRILFCGKVISRKNPKFEHVNQSIYTDRERMPRISAGNPIHKSYERNPGKILPVKGKITGWEHVHP